MSTQPQPGWGPPPPPPPQPKRRKAWHETWWIVGIIGFLVGLLLASAAEPTPGVQTRVETQERTVPSFVEDCNKYPDPIDKRDCGRWQSKTVEDAQGAVPATTAPKPKPTTPPAATIEDGTWAVPDEVKPGTYVSDGGEGCYWARLRNLSGSVDAIIANSISPGRQRVTIARTDKAFETSNCDVWRKVG
jgi:hypothetical protein